MKFSLSYTAAICLLRLDLKVRIDHALGRRAGMAPRSAEAKETDWAPQGDTFAAQGDCYARKATEIHRKVTEMTFFAQDTVRRVNPARSAGREAGRIGAPSRMGLNFPPGGSTMVP